MILYVIRHGQTDSNLKGIVSGRIDERLNLNGIKQSQKLNLKIADTHFDAVYVSPMRRAVETAEIIVPEYQYLIDGRIAERDIASLQNRTIDELWQNPLWNSLSEKRTEEGAETLGSGIERVQDFLTELSQKYPNKDSKILVVTHSFVSRCIWAIVNNITGEKKLSNFSHQNVEIKIYNYQ